MMAGCIFLSKKKEVTVLYNGCPDGTFEMAEDWLVECILCGQQYRIDRRSLNISVMEQGDVFEHYEWCKPFIIFCC